MPYSNTIARASDVTFSRSLAAPFVTRPKTTRSAGEPDLHPVDQLLARVQVAVLVGQVERVAERVSARHDRGLLHGIAHEVRHHGVASLVVREDATLLLGDDAALLKAADDPLERRLEVRLRDVVAVVARGEDRCLVCDVGQVRTG